MSKTRIKLGMVGGGPTAFIGAVHRIAMRIDDRFELVAGALDVDATRGRAFAETLGIAPDRAYDNYQELIDKEAKRPDRIDAVVVVTPNFLHFPVASAALKAGFDVICEKPMTTTLEDAEALAKLVETTGRRFFLTHTYTGYPMVRQAREMIAAGEIGKLRRVEVEYLQDWLAAPVENTGAEGAVWRTDPKKAGAGGAIGDVGTHAWNLAAFVTGEEPTHLLAELSTLVEGRRVDDDAAILLRYASGAKGSILASQVAAGQRQQRVLPHLRRQGRPRMVAGKARGAVVHPARRTAPDDPPQRCRRDQRRPSPAAACRPLHPEGYLEAFANLYRDAADLIAGKAASTMVPSARDGVSGSKFIEACLKSNAAGNALD